MPKLFSKKETQQINLLPEREFAGTVTGRVLSWIISTFRIIVIVTEILVMIAFLSRFWLDAQNTDLTEELEEKKSIVAAAESFERQFKDTQKRIKIYSSLVNTSISSTYLKLVVQSLPPDVTLVEISKLEEEVEITGNTSNERSVQQLVANLSATKRFANVSLQEIQSNPTNASLVTFTIKALVTNEGGPL